MRIRLNFFGIVERHFLTAIGKFKHCQNQIGRTLPIKTDRDKKLYLAVNDFPEQKHRRTPRTVKDNRLYANRMWKVQFCSHRDQIGKHGFVYIRDMNAQLKPADIFQYARDHSWALDERDFFGNFKSFLWESGYIVIGHQSNKTHHIDWCDLFQWHDELAIKLHLLFFSGQRCHAAEFSVFAVLVGVGNETAEAIFQNDLKLC